MNSAVWTPGRQWRTPAVAALLAAAMTVVGLLGWPARAVAADGATFRVDPPSLTVDSGEIFIVRIVQNAAVPTIGAQTNVVFDARSLQILDMKPGPDYAKGLFLYGSADDGSSASAEAAIAKANETGVLRNVATFLLPGSGSVPPGEALVVELTLRATGTDGGTQSVRLRRLHLLDEGGIELPVSTINATVTLRPSATASGGASSPPPSATSTPPPSGGVAAATHVAGAAVGPAAVTVVPASGSIALLTSTTIDLKVRTHVPASSVTADLVFDRSVLQITNIEAGPAWSQAVILAGGAGLTLAQAIEQANETGSLSGVGVFLPPGSTTMPTGEGAFLTVSVKGLIDGTSSLTLTRASVFDGLGQDLDVTLTSARLVVGSGGGPSPLLIGGALLAVVTVSGGIFLARSTRRGRP